LENRKRGEGEGVIGTGRGEIKKKWTLKRNQRGELTARAPETKKGTYNPVSAKVKWSGDAVDERKVNNLSPQEGKRNFVNKGQRVVKDRVREKPEKSGVDQF